MELRLPELTDATLEELDSAEAKALIKALADAKRLIPPSIQMRLRKALTIKAMPFFDFYIMMRRIKIGGPVPGGLRILYKRAADRLAQVRSPVDQATLSPAAVNALALTRQEVYRAIRRIEQGRMTAIYWGQFNAVMVPLIVQIARDKGVFIRPTKQIGVERWATFRRMSPKQERMEVLRDDDPESFVLMEKLGQTMAEIDANIESRILAEGKQVKRGFLAGRPVTISVDPATDEEMVHDRDGDVLTRSEFFVKVRAKADARAALSRVPTRTSVPPSELRTISDEELERAEGVQEWDAITDDKAKQGKLTRLFPTKWLPSTYTDETTGEEQTVQYKVVAEGRYKGVLLDDLVNSEGRLIEGTAYTYDVKKGRETGVPRNIDPSEREPYVTLTEVVSTRQFQGRQITVKTKKLYVKIEGSRQSSVLRNALKKIACNVGAKTGCISSVSYVPVPGSNAAGFYFDPKDFGVVMGSLQGMTLSSAALDEVRSYYNQLAAAESATKYLDAYAPETLASESDSGEQFQFIKGSFNQDGDWRPFDLREKQRESIAWLDANGNSGVCALETGTGKTAVSIGMMLKLVRDGLSEEDATYTRPDGTDVRTNGRFLFVCPTSLRGNIKRELRIMLSDPRVMVDRVDVLSYRQFSGASKSGAIPRSLRGVPFWKNRGKVIQSKKVKVWDPALYTAIFFDEAQEMKRLSSGASQAALRLYHPRKVCLTASPMERNPMEAYVLAAVTNNTPLFGRSLEAQTNRKEMRRFKERFCEVVGGRIVGVKQDPLVLRDLHTWVKRNIFHADKTDVKEYRLPDRVAAVTPVEMPAEVEALYRDVSSGFTTVMEGAARKFSERRKTDPYGDRQAEKVFSRMLAPIIELLTEMSNRPASALRDVAFAVEKGYLPRFVDPEGKPRPLPKSFRDVLKKWQAQYTPDDLRRMAAQVGNPKIEAAEDTLASKLDYAGSSRALLFSDDREMCLEAGIHMAKTLGGTHVVALGDVIRFFRGGTELSRLVFPLNRDLLNKLVKDPEERHRILTSTNGLTEHELPLRRRSYKLHPALPGKQGVHQVYSPDEWQQFALKELVNDDPSVLTATLLGKVYMFGHNLQAFNTVIHLDRDSWNSESMKQRTARAWRQGQNQVVDEITIDHAYRPDDRGRPRNENDVTLDHIRKLFQDMDADIFDRIIKDAQRIALGEEWGRVKKTDASLWGLNDKVVELMMSPMLGRAS